MQVDFFALCKELAINTSGLALGHLPQVGTCILACVWRQSLIFLGCLYKQILAAPWGLGWVLIPFQRQLFWCGPNELHSLLKYWHGATSPVWEIPFLTEAPLMKLRSTSLNPGGHCLGPWLPWFQVKVILEMHAFPSQLYIKLSPCHLSTPHSGYNWKG